MGNCQKEKFSDSTMDTKIFESIKSGSCHRLSSIISFINQRPDKSFLDNLQFKHKNVTTNPLGYSLLLNKAEVFSKLISAGCSPGAMEKLFQLSQFNSIEYLVQKNYLEVLKVYFPMYQTLEVPTNASVERYSIGLSLSFKVKCIPIHIAAIKGFLGVVSFFYEFFQGKSVPFEYDIESLEENTGENSALLACRYGHFELVKYLHCKAGANFNLVNFFKENALIVTMAAMNKDPDYKFVNIFRYLLEIVKVDPCYMYEEAAVLAKCKAMFNLLSEHLKKVGIIIQPKEFDENSFVYVNPNEESTLDPAGQIFTVSFLANPNFPEIRSIPSSIYASILSTNSKQSEFI